MASNPDQTQQQESQPADGEGENGFKAAFAERSADLAGRKVEPPSDGPRPSEQAPADAGATEAPSKEATDAGTSGTADKADPWEGLTPEQMRQRLNDLQAERDRLQQSDRSQRGRLGAHTRKIHTLESEIAALKTAPAKTEEKGSANEGGASDGDDEFKKALEDYPDVVGPFAKKLDQLQAKIDKIQAPAATESEIDKDARELTEAYAQLEGEHPDYAQIAADQNFRAWLGDQPDKVKALSNSYDPAEVSLVLSKFKLQRSAAIAASGDGRDAGKQETTATDEKRRRQLDGSKQVPTRGAPVVAGVPNDFSSAFKARAAATAKA